MNRIYWVPDLHTGGLGMMARPRGHDWLTDEINHLKMQGIDQVVSLLERAEAYELGLLKEAKKCEEMRIEFINFPIPDRGLPDDRNAFIRLAKSLNESLNQGKRIAMHCRMGIGRTSLLCAAILVVQGSSIQTIFDKLSQIRTLKVPDTPAQKAWLEKFGEELEGSS